MKPLLTALALLLFTTLTNANETLTISDAWIREAPPSARVLAAYLTIHNHGSQERVLTSIESPRFETVMLHKSEIVDGMARMQHVEQIAIPAGASLELAPGGYHLMIAAPKQRLKSGSQITFLLHFANSQTVEVDARVGKP